MGQNTKYPPILYKYRNWENKFHKQILTKNTLYFASPSNFEDIHDCNLPKKIPTKDELLEYFTNEAKQEYPQWSRAERREYARNRAKKSSLRNKGTLSKALKKHNEEFNQNIGILSMTTDCNNDEMWHKYANNHHGLCIGFDTKLLSTSAGGGGEVKYVHKLPEIDYINEDFCTKHIKNIYLKEDKWSFEKEYRLHKWWGNNATEKDRNIELPKDCIVKIILGKNMSETAKEEIKAISKDKYPNAEIIENI